MRFLPSPLLALECNVITYLPACTFILPLFQLNSIDYGALLSNFQTSLAHLSEERDVTSFQPVKDVIREDELPLDIKNACMEKGYELIRSKQVGVMILSGGQGTRLKRKEPKGCVDLSLPSTFSLFEYHVKRLRFSFP